MAQFSIDLSGRGGLTNNYFGDSDQTVATNNRNFLGTDGQMVDGFFNPFMRVGFLSPSVSTLGATTVDTVTLDANIGSVMYDVINDDLYLAERGNQIFHFDGLDDTSLVRDINLTGSVIHDQEIYQVNGVRKLFYVYTKGGNCNVGISSLPSGTNNPDWLTVTTSGAFTNATTSPRNFIITSDNGFAYLCQDYNVHKIDGTSGTGGANGTVTPNSLSFPPYFRVTDGLDNRGHIFFVIHQSSVDVTAISSGGTTLSGPVGVYIWDRSTTTASVNDFIPVPGVSAIQTIFIGPTGGVRLFCIGANRLPQIREFDGHSFPIVREFSLGAYPRFPDSLVVAGSLTMWLGTDGTVYAFGVPHSEPGGAEVLAKIGQAVATSSTTPAASVNAGAIFYGAGSSFSSASGYRADRQGLTVCYQTLAAVNTIKKFYPFDKGTINSNAQFALQGDIFTPVKALPTMSTVQSMNIYCLTGSTAGSTVQATLRIYFNGSSTEWAAKTITRDDIVKGYKHIEINKPYINSVQVKIEYPTGVTLADTVDFHPSVAIVNYEPSTDRG